MKLRFLGRDFATLAELQQAYPKYSTPDIMPFIRAGASTPQEVEQAVWEKRNRKVLRKAYQKHRNSMKAGMSRLARAPRRRKAA